MPTVPLLDPSQLATPSQAPDVQGSSVASAGLFDQGAQQASDAGTALSQASDAQSQIAVDAQNRMNQTFVDDGRNTVQAQAYAAKYGPEGYKNKTGAAAITPDANGQMPADAAITSLNDTAATVRAKLSNPMQQRMFDDWYGGFATQFHGEALAHEGQQTRQYSLDTNTATQKLAQDSAAQDFANLSLLNEHVASAGDAAYKSAQVVGLQGPALVQSVKQSETATILSAYNAAVAKGDFNSATAIQSKYGAFMTADAAIEVDRQQTIITNNQLATNAAARATAGQAISLTPSGQAFAANVSVESGGKQTNADGTPVTSSKGAVGIAQVLPSTAQETANNHGIPWDPAKFATDSTYNRLLGQTYWQDQLAANNGDVAKADAAYNGGPGALQAAIGKANAAGTPAAWLQYMSPETQAYVSKVAAARQTGVGAALMPTKLDIINSVTADPTLQNNPVAMKAAVELAGQRWEAAQEAVKQNRATALSSAQTILLQNGGNMAGVPPQLLSSMDPKDVPGVMKYASDIRQGGTTTNQALFADVVTHLDKYTALSDQQWYAVARPNLSEADFKTLTMQRADARNAVPSNGPGNVNLSALNAALDQRLTTMGLDPHPPMIGPHADADMASRVDAIRSLVTQNVYEAQRQANRKFSQDEVAKQIDLTLLQTAPTEGRSFLGRTLVSRSTLPAMTADEIPTAINKQILADLKVQGVLEPTSGQRLGAYWYWQQHPSRMR